MKFSINTLNDSALDIIADKAAAFMRSDDDSIVVSYDIATPWDMLHYVDTISISRSDVKSADELVDRLSEPVIIMLQASPMDTFPSPDLFCYEQDID